MAPPPTDRPAAEVPGRPAGRAEPRARLVPELVRLLTAGPDLRGLFERVAEAVHGLTGCDRVSLVPASADGGPEAGFALEFVGGLRWVDLPPPAGSAAAWVLHNRQPHVADRLDGKGPFAEDRGLYAQGYRSYALLPLVHRDRVVGVLGLASRAAGRPGHWDPDLLADVSALLALAVAEDAARARAAALAARLEQEHVYLRAEARAEQGFARFKGDSPATQAVRRAVAQVAATDSTVLVLGETGTGKELVARAVHERSGRRGQLLVAVNCAALAPGLLASELFGHEAGAFTGASRRRVGRFELAHRGTLFLDEVGELAPETQVLLLRALQERVIERVGGNTPVPVDVRVVAATNRDLAAAVAAGAFRADLFYRLNVFPIRLPPLRERPEDIPALLEHFTAHFSRRMGRPAPRVGRRTLELAAAYPWPGNIRELENLVERAMIVTAGDTLEIDAAWLAPAATAPAAPPRPALAEQERRAILDALRHCGGRIYGPGGAAALLGVKPTTLYGKMRRHRIRKTSGTDFE
jgi:formate hydrogenlyase transcriptional activator